MHPPRSSKTFGMYCCDEVLSPIVRSGIKRSDFIFDIYRSDSLKKGERIRRGSNDNRFSVRKKTSIPRNFIAFLGNDSNKTELFYLIADVITEGENQHMTIVGTRGIGVVSNKEINKYNISPCTQEDADTRIFIHVRELLNRFPRIKVVIVDSGVVITALFVFFKLQREKEIDELWIEFGVGKFKRWIPIHRYTEALRENVCNALPFFHAFTGSDTTSQFAGRWGGGGEDSLENMARSTRYDRYVHKTVIID